MMQTWIVIVVISLVIQSKFVGDERRKAHRDVSDGVKLNSVHLHKLSKSESFLSEWYRDAFVVSFGKEK